MTLGQRHVTGIVVRAVGLALLAGILLALEWAWRTHAWNDLKAVDGRCVLCLLYTSPSPRDVEESRMPSSA